MSRAGEQETATSTALNVPRLSFTRTLREGIEQTGFLRATAGVLRTEAGELQARMFEAALEERAAEHARLALQTLLTKLAGAGFAWRDVARLAGVSVPAVQKWRAGGGAAPEHRRRVAKIAALCDLMSSQQFGIEDVVSWLEMRLRPDVPVTGMDLLAAGRTDLLLRWAAHTDAGPEAILDDFEPGWRRVYDHPYEVFTAADGHPGIRFRDA